MRHNGGLDLGPTLTAKFDAYLNGSGPIGVAVSGGGDSVALLYALSQWGKRPLHVFCVDHGLNPQSPTWTQSVAQHAARLGATFTALEWTGEKPKTGLSAAARTARHALLADAARVNGIHVLCLAHTADDILEARHMQAEGSNVGAPVEWAPSPAWPQGSGVFLFRPLLDVRRDTLREGLCRHAISWIDDPANSNLDSHRARARLAIQDRQIETSGPVTQAYPADLFDLHPLGLIRLDAPVLASLPKADALKVLAAAVVCAGGGDKLPRSAELETVLSGLDNGKTMTLCGARVWRDGSQIDVVREAGDITRSGRGTLRVGLGDERMWDGRFSITAQMPVRITASRRTDLNDADQSSLGYLLARLRAILPMFEDENGSKGLAGHPFLFYVRYKPVHALCWVSYRFRAALGMFRDEAELARFLQ